jgi:hypothetical protein
MTTPDERLRAIRFGWEVLTRDLMGYVPDDLKPHVDMALKDYPQPQALLGLLDNNNSTLPVPWAHSLTETYRLLLELRRRSELTEKLGWAVHVTLRHFPDPLDIEHHARIPGLRGWLAPERK